MNIMPLKYSQKGFTIIELLISSVVIAIMVIFLVSMLQKVNMRSRDAVRLSDMTNLFQAIQVSIQNDDSDEKLYYLLCSQVKTPCAEKSFPLLQKTQNIDGTGWLKIALNRKSLLSYAILPLDPINDDKYNYSYWSDGKSWKLETKLESENFKEKMKTDGGIDPEKYELTQKLK